MKCSGSEASLFECRHKTQDNCGRGEGAGVRCRGMAWHVINIIFKKLNTVGSITAAADVSSGNSAKLELKGGSNSREGNVFVNGKPVCDDNWGREEAIVACGMLG